ncbi:MAG: hypothetical protein HXX14_11360 [Bacteroidetes bacterium]|nr:hypothetical protein [Bacteroidota bacterium]
MAKFTFIFIILLFIQQNLIAQKSHLFLLAGQSNSVGQGDSAASVKCKPNTAFEFNANSNSFIQLKDPVGKSWKLFQQAQTGSIAPSFANRLYELTHRSVYIVTTARSGASCHRKAEMADYDTWDSTGKLFADAVEKTKMATITAKHKLSGIIWMQGERDANAILNGQLTLDEYQEALEGLIKRFRDKFGKKLPFYIVLIAYQQDKPKWGCDAVRSVEQKVASKIKRVYIAYSQTGEFAQHKWFKDIVHYNQDALNDIGIKTAEFIAFGNKNKLNINAKI